MKETVKNTGGSVIDLEDGRVLGPGDTADDVDTEARHNVFLMDLGLITAVQSDPDEDAGPPAAAKKEK